MATTLTTAYVYGSNATVCNLGDSRSYLIRNHELQQITRDHTLAEELRSHGMPTHVTHAYRNVVTRCFDTSGKPANFDLFHLDLRSDDRLLLCSDGLTNMVSDSELMQIIRVAESTEEACRMLAATALRNGGKDNITLILAHLTGADSSPIVEASETLCMDTTLTN
jgi:protein phosphatase